LDYGPLGICLNPGAWQQTIPRQLHGCKNLKFIIQSRAEYDVDKLLEADMGGSVIIYRSFWNLTNNKSYPNLGKGPFYLKSICLLYNESNLVRICVFLLGQPSGLVVSS
jgi:hypothetical protein